MKWFSFTTELFIRESTEYTLYPFFRRVFEASPLASSTTLFCLATLLGWLIEAYFIPFHWGFVWDKVHPCDYKLGWMRFAFPMELISLFLVHLVTKPFNMPFEEPWGLPIWEWVTYAHLAIHVWHTFYVFKWLPPQLHIRPEIYKEIPGRFWVFVDSSVHTINTLRYMTVSHPYQWLFASVLWLSILRSVDHRSFVKENPAPNEHYNDWVPNPWLKAKADKDKSV